MKDETILNLQDYSPVPPEAEQFCKELQAQIKANYSNIYIPPQLRSKTEAFPVVFDTYQGRYRTQAYAGILAYGGRTVVIHSRFDGADSQNNRFLYYTLNKADILPKIVQDLGPGMNTGSFLPLMVYLFLRQLREAYNVGIYRQYRTYAYNDARPHGHIDIARHIRLNPLMNGRIAYSTREYTADNPINRLILAAYQVLEENEETAELLEQISAGDPALLAPLKVLQREVGQVRLNGAGRQKLLAQTLHPITHPLHQRYEPVRITAILILNQTGLDLCSPTEGEVAGILYPMDNGWEKFLEHAVFQHLQKKGYQIAPQEPIPILYEETTRKAQRELTPDFLFDRRREENGRITARAVFDAKYRAAWGKTAGGSWGRANVRDNVFQILAYQLVTGAKISGAVFPVRERDCAQPKIRSYQLCTGMEDHSFLTVPFCVCEEEKNETFEQYSEKLDARCRALAEELDTVLKAIDAKSAAT